MSRKTVLPKSLIRRAYVLICIAITIYILLAIRISFIVTTNNENYRERVSNQSTEKIELNSGRGTIYDRNNNKLTDTQLKKVIIVNKSRFYTDEKTKELLEEVSKSKDEAFEKEFTKSLTEQLNQGKEKDNESPVSTIIQIEVDSIDYKLEKKLVDNNIKVESKSMRYREDGLLSHVIGYVNWIDNKGVYGIESKYDSILNESNKQYVSVFKAGQSGNEEYKYIGALDGTYEKVEKNDEDRHIKITVDRDIQKVVEDAVDKIVNPTAVVISDVETGEILAMSSRPNYNQYKPPIESNDSTTESAKNKAMQELYPPGSIFKIVVLYAALENNIIDESYTHNCVGSIDIGNEGEKLSCAGNQVHGVQTLEETFSNSCNLAFYDIAKKVGREKILEAVEKLHLDEIIDIGLLERDAEIPENEYISQLAIGQGGLSFTPIQINQMTQIIANNGTYQPLYLYDSIIDSNQNIIKVFKSSKEKEIISPYTISKIKDMMVNVSEEGTGKDLKDLEGGSGIKTGSAEVGSVEAGNETTHGWVSGYYPKNNPKYAITILAEDVEGSKDVIPIFKEICTKIK